MVGSRGRLTEVHIYMYNAVWQYIICYMRKCGFAPSLDFLAQKTLDSRST